MQKLITLMMIEKGCSGRLLVRKKMERTLVKVQSTGLGQDQIVSANKAMILKIIFLTDAGMMLNRKYLA
jgi:hypothetical protein